MATDEEYLDSLLKTVMENAPDPVPDAKPLEESDIPSNAEADFEMPEIPSFDEESLIDAELPAFDDLPILEDEPLIAEELPVFEDEPLVTDELPVLEDEPLVAEELPVFEDEPLVADELPVLEDEPLVAEELPILEDEPLVDDELPVFDEKVDLSLDGMPSIDELSPDVSANDDEAMLSDLDLDAMFAEMDENIDLPELGQDSDSEASMEAASMEEMDISDLLAGMNDDEDLSGIKDLLDKDENNELIDDDMLSLLDGVSGYSSEGEDDNDVMALFNEAEAEPHISSEPKKKAKEKRGRRKKGEDLSDEEFALSPEDIDAQLGVNKKKGIFSRLFAALTEADDESEEIDVKIQSISAENLDILDELSKEDVKDKKKTKKDKKAPKEKKEKPPKEKKEKKPKKEKLPKEPQEPEKPAKRISKKKILLVFMFSITLMAAIIAFCMLVPDYLEREEAKLAYQSEDHRNLFGLLYAKNRSIADELLFQQSQVILRMNRPKESYEIFKSMDKPVEALNALLMGVNRYDEIQADDSYGVEYQINMAYQELLGILSAVYGLSEADARNLLTMDGESYTKRLYELALNVDFSSMPSAVSEGFKTEPEMPEHVEDIEADHQMIEETFESILEDYTIKMQNETPRLVDEFNSEAVAFIENINVLAEMNYDKIAELADISSEGINKMEELMIVNQTSHEEYDEWAAKLMDAYVVEAAKISDAYMALATQ